MTIGLTVAKRFEWKDVPGYVITQVIAGLAAGAALYGIARGKGASTRWATWPPTATASTPRRLPLMAVLCAEALLTAFFLYIILGATHDRAPSGFAPLAIGLGLT